MVGPNEEQKKAIEHHGGVLLSAGAGSGKTFVLVEHVIYLASEKLKAYREKTPEEKGQLLKNDFTRIVLMTYTKKAAGELSVRLKTRVEELIEKSDDPRGWGMISQCLDSMYVGTIHGFCFRLLGQGFFPSIHPEIKLIDETEFRARMADFYERWLESRQGQLKKRGEDIYELFLLSEREIVSSLCSIMSDPEMRDLWSQVETQASPLEEYFELIEKISKLLEVDNVLHVNFDLAEYSANESKAWYKYLALFQQWTKGLDQKNLEKQTENLNALLDGVSELRARKPTGKSVSEDLATYYENVKILVDFLKRHRESLVAYIGEGREVCQNYFESFHELVSFVEKRYDSSAEMTFADLEYNVLKGLESKEVRGNIAASYNYFIVDEFQDTSEIQYQILKRLTGEDFRKLFCVGDVKQAIYGFRGGEVAVFKRCMDYIPLNISLKNNYRSLPEIIEFNNSLFEFLFSRGLEYSESNDPHSVPVERQSVPQEKTGEFQGKIIKRVVDVTTDEQNGDKLRPVEIDYVEAQSIIAQIRDYFEQGESEVCLLYKNLRPSLYLLQDMIGRELTLKAQVKVSYGEDPLIDMFFHALEFAVQKQSSHKYEEQMINALCEILSLTLKFFDLHLNSGEMHEKLEVFYEDYALWGISTAFYKLLYSLGISNSNYEQNYKVIDTIVDVNGNDLSTTLSHLRDYLGDKYSIEFHSGNGEKLVKVMTTHASKGLQFDNVILGGIHTNGRTRPNDNDFGKYPRSFKWKHSPAQKSKFKTPKMLIEGETSKRKDFAESKRLFYVACTRAKKSLSWMDIWTNSTSPASHSKNSWIVGIREFEKMLVAGKQNSISQMIAKECRQMTYDMSHSNEDQLQTNSTPLFHRDRLGVECRQNEHSKLGVLPDLSVTRLALVTECPRKFFLRNICQFSDDELDVLGLKKNFANREEGSAHAPSIEERKSSSAERGTLIHDEISQFFDRNMTLPLKTELTDLDDILKWVSRCYQESAQNHSPDIKLYSETPLKFPFFGFMISGIPDLVIQSSSRLEVWDFKTGRPSPEKENSYWFQLKAYAYALSQRFDDESEFPELVLKLLYVDTQEEKTMTIQNDQLINELACEWKKLNNLSQMNLSHCPQCPFGNLCHPSS